MENDPYKRINVYEITNIAQKIIVCRLITANKGGGALYDR